MVPKVSSRLSCCASSHRYVASASFFCSTASNTRSSAREASMLSWGTGTRGQGGRPQRAARGHRAAGPGAAGGRGPGLHTASLGGMGVWGLGLGLGGSSQDPLWDQDLLQGPPSLLPPHLPPSLSSP